MRKLIFLGCISFGTFLLGAMTYKRMVEYIPYPHRQNIFDILDYMSGVNLFNRSDSKM